jgi:hypothetical protein
MTGSGSAVFGIFPTRQTLERARRNLSSVRNFAVSFVSRKRYQSAWKRALKQHTKGDQWPPQSRYAR